jgi:hypothetical protein
MNLVKSIPLVLVACIVVLSTQNIALQQAQAAAPPYPASIYIRDVRVGNPTNPLDYSTGGVRLLLTSTGDSVGNWWNGAMALAYFAINSWESQTGRPWPYQWRSTESVAREIQVHCWLFDTTTRTTTISFSGW